MINDDKNVVYKILCSNCNNNYVCYSSTYVKYRKYNHNFSLKPNVRLTQSF